MTKYEEKFERMRIAGKLASSTLDMLTDFIKPGISTDKIDQLAFDFIKDKAPHRFVGRLKKFYLIKVKKSP